MPIIGVEIMKTIEKKVIFTEERLQLTTLTAKETITNLTQYELSQEESDLLKADLHYSIEPDKNPKPSLPLK